MKKYALFVAIFLVTVALTMPAYAEHFRQVIGPIAPAETEMLNVCIDADDEQSFKQADYITLEQDGKVVFAANEISNDTKYKEYVISKFVKTAELHSTNGLNRVCAKVYRSGKIMETITDIDILTVSFPCIVGGIASNSSGQCEPLEIDKNKVGYIDVLNVEKASDLKIQLSNIEQTGEYKGGVATIKLKQVLSPSRRRFEVKLSGISERLLKNGKIGLKVLLNDFSVGYYPIDNTNIFLAKADKRYFSREDMSIETPVTKPYIKYYPEYTMTAKGIKVMIEVVNYPVGSKFKVQQVDERRNGVSEFKNLSLKKNDKGQFFIEVSAKQTERTKKMGPAEFVVTDPNKERHDIDAFPSKTSYTVVLKSSTPIEPYSGNLEQVTLQPTSPALVDYTYCSTMMDPEHVMGIGLKNAPSVSWEADGTYGIEKYGQTIFMLGRKFGSNPPEDLYWMDSLARKHLIFSRMEHEARFNRVNISKDGMQVYYLNKKGLMAYDVKTEQEKTLVNESKIDYFTFDAEYKNALCCVANKIIVSDMATGKVIKELLMAEDVRQACMTKSGEIYAISIYGDLMLVPKGGKGETGKKIMARVDNLHYEKSIDRLIVSALDSSKDNQDYNRLYLLKGNSYTKISEPFRTYSCITNAGDIYYIGLEEIMYEGDSVSQFLISEKKRYSYLDASKNIYDSVNMEASEDDGVYENKQTMVKNDRLLYLANGRGKIVNRLTGKVEIQFNETCQFADLSDEGGILYRKNGKMYIQNTDGTVMETGILVTDNMSNYKLYDECAIYQYGHAIMRWSKETGNKQIFGMVSDQHGAKEMVYKGDSELSTMNAMNFFWDGESVFVITTWGDLYRCHDSGLIEFIRPNVESVKVLE